MNEHILWALTAGAIHVAGVLSAVNALLTPRSSQSAIAWAISCVTFPYLAVPAYWLLGRNRFHGYVLARRSSKSRLRKRVKGLREYAPGESGLPRELSQSCQAFERLAAMPFTQGNTVNLLVDGEPAFEAIFREIERARDYIFVQFFIVRSDALGQRMREALRAKVKQGVRAYFLYDRIGSHALSSRFVESLREAGVRVQAFKPPRGWSNRFQINFRNHRKMVVVDGRWAATGGMNLGEEYCGHSKQFGYWRDTMVEVTGPAVQEIQLSFAEDWFFLTQSVPKLNWSPADPEEGKQAVLVLPTGPADELHSCSMMFTQAIHAAQTRLWITNPYFVPDNEIVRALQLAALRGVDVRMLLPSKANHLLVHWASCTYLEDLKRTGVRFLRYTKGLLHEKVMLVDDGLALVGTANTDNRSFYLNFELTLLVADRHFASDVEAMFHDDFEHSRETGNESLNDRGLFFQIAARLSRLLSPVL